MSGLHLRCHTPDLHIAASLLLLVHSTVNNESFQHSTNLSATPATAIFELGYYSTRETATPLRVVDHGRRSSGNIEINCPASCIAILRSNHAILPWQCAESTLGRKKTLEKVKKAELRKCNLLPRSTNTHARTHTRVQHCSMKSSHVTQVHAGRCAALDLRTLGCEMAQRANLTRTIGLSLSNTVLLVLAHCQNWSSGSPPGTGDRGDRLERNLGFRGSPRDRGDRLKRNLGKIGY